MRREQGHYGIVQFFPEPDLLEGVNVGVYVLCPAQNAFEVLMSTSNARVRRRFGDATFDSHLLDEDKGALRDRLMSSGIRSLEALKDFRLRESGNLILSEPKSIAITDIRVDARELFAALVPGSDKKRREKVAPPDLRPFFEPLMLGAQIQRDVTVPVPKLGQRIHAPYAYLNKAMNYIIPHGFSPNEKDAIRSAEHIGVQGVMLNRHPVTLNGESVQQQLVIVGESTRKSTGDKLREFFMDFPMRYIPVNDVAPFAQEVRAHARHLPSVAR
jgi:hypothetical protein